MFTSCHAYNGCSEFAPASPLEEEGLSRLRVSKLMMVLKRMERGSLDRFEPSVAREARSQRRPKLGRDEQTAFAEECFNAEGNRTETRVLQQCSSEEAAEHDDEDVFEMELPSSSADWPALEVQNRIMPAPPRSRSSSVPADQEWDDDDASSFTDTWEIVDDDLIASVTAVEEWEDLEPKPKPNSFKEAVLAWAVAPVTVARRVPSGATPPLRPIMIASKQTAKAAFDKNTLQDDSSGGGAVGDEELKYARRSRKSRSSALIRDKRLGLDAKPVGRV